MWPKILLHDQSFNAYLNKITKFPILSDLEEHELVNRWVNTRDIQAAHTLVTSHLRLVTKTAFQFRNYGFSLMELVAEGTLGLMKAIRNFDPKSGCRVATYAMWWIKSAIQEYILKSWSLVRIGTTNAQRKLFFNLRKLQRKSFTTSQIAKELSVEESDVEKMDQALSDNNRSLDYESNMFNEAFLQEDHQEKKYADQELFNQRKNLLLEALNSLDERYKEVLIARKLTEVPITLNKLSKIYKISSERVRQIEAQAMKKLKEIMLNKLGHAN